MISGRSTVLLPFQQLVTWSWEDFAGVISCRLAFGSFVILDPLPVLFLELVSNEPAVVTRITSLVCGSESRVSIWDTQLAFRLTHVDLCFLSESYRQFLGQNSSFAT